MLKAVVRNLLGLNDRWRAVIPPKSEIEHSKFKEILIFFMIVDYWCFSSNAKLDMLEKRKVLCEKNFLCLSRFIRGNHDFIWCSWKWLQSRLAVSDVFMIDQLTLPETDDKFVPQIKLEIWRFWWMLFKSSQNFSTYGRRRNPQVVLEVESWHLGSDLCRSQLHCTALQAGDVCCN